MPWLLAVLVFGIHLAIVGNTASFNFLIWGSGGSFRILQLRSGQITVQPTVRSTLFRRAHATSVCPQCRYRAHQASPVRRHHSRSMNVAWITGPLAAAACNSGCLGMLQNVSQAQESLASHVFPNATRGLLGEIFHLFKASVRWGNLPSATISPNKGNNLELPNLAGLDCRVI